MKLALAVMVIAACGDNEQPAPPASCLPGCGAMRTYDAIGYDLHARFDWETRQLIATEDITLDTTASGPIVELDAAVAITRVHAGDQPIAFVADSTTLRVDLSPLAGTTVTFSIDYTATPSDSLIPTRSRDDDPVISRVVFTDSEPDRALAWLVTKLDPSDRARWSVEVAVEPDEDVVANGTRVRDTMVEGKRHVGYALEQPIPMYLMAFAAGQLDHTDRTTGRVPLSVWHRRGLVLDAERTLDVVADAMATFEGLLMPYPWASYSVVLLPNVEGMENATITFDDETSGQNLIDLTLNAHELAHHWFGDWVTMHGFADLWWKEGMATILQWEADRARRDRERAGRRFGTDLTFKPTDAIVDDRLIGSDKYTSGPYERAGWMITQLRTKVGEVAFWDSLRGFLAAHAVGSATGEEFLRSFPIDEATVQQLLAALPQKSTPQLALALAPSGADTSVKLTLTDPGALVLQPIEITVVDARGAATTSHLAAGTPLTLTVPAGGYLAPDEADVHPSWTTDFGVDRATYTQLRGLFVPKPTAAPAVIAAFESRSAAVQERGRRLPIAVPGELAGYLAALDSDRARQTAAVLACERTKIVPSWTAAARAVLDAPARLELDSRFASCGDQPGLASQIAPLLATGTPAALARIAYLLAFDYADATLATVAPVATSAPSLALRELALARLTDQAEGLAGYPAIPTAQEAQWAAFFEARFTPTMSEPRFQTIVEVVTAIGDTAALPTIAALLHELALSDATQVHAICAALTLAGGSMDANWTAFANAAKPWDQLAPAAAATLVEPGRCGQQLTRPGTRRRGAR